MKKKIALTLAALLLMGVLAGCGAKSTTESETPQNPQPEAAAETQKATEDTYSVDGSVIFDKDGGPSPPRDWITTQPPRTQRLSFGWT